MKTLSAEDLTESAPQIIKDLPSIIQPIDGVTTLEVKVIGQPKPDIKWLKQGEEIVASEEYQIENFEDGTSILVINDVYPDDAGIFTFEATNPLGVAVARTELVIGEGINLILILYTIKIIYGLIVKFFYSGVSINFFFVQFFLFLLYYTHFTRLFNEIFLLLQILHLVPNESKFSNYFEFL